MLGAGAMDGTTPVNQITAEGSLVEGMMSGQVKFGPLEAFVDNLLLIL